MNADNRAKLFELLIDLPFIEVMVKARYDYDGVAVRECRGLIAGRSIKVRIDMNHHSFDFLIGEGGA